MLLSLCISFWFRIMHCCTPTHTSDNNSSTHMDMSVVNCQGIVRECHIVWRVVTLGATVHDMIRYNMILCIYSKKLT